MRDVQVLVVSCALTCAYRLSDYLFVAARFVAMKDGKPETVYRKHQRVVREAEQQHTPTTEGAVKGDDS